VPQVVTWRRRHPPTDNDVRTPQTARQTALASLYTAGSVSGVSAVSGLSSLGQSEVSVSEMTQTLRRRLNTRQLVLSDGRDSDDDDTDGEDLYEVDHAQNFWQS
jgi:hypothetical protein